LSDSADAGTWIVPFKGRNHSGSVQQNFLWRDGAKPVYIMDNHRAAMWCWLQEMEQDELLNLLHIDEHYDTLYANIDTWMKHLPPLDGISIEDYLSLQTNTGLGNTPLIRWDTYLSLFLERYRARLDHCIFATHKNGDAPRVKSARHPEIYELADNVSFWIGDVPGRWIVNVDLDYFFCEMAGEHKQMVSSEYLETLFAGVREQLSLGRIAVLTLCLTPDEDYTGGWAAAERMCQQICSIIGIEFALPPLESSAQ